MQNLKRITYINIVLYGIFICLNVLEVLWNSYKYSLGNKPQAFSAGIDCMNSFMRITVFSHDILNLLALLLQIVFLYFCNQVVKKNQLGKSYHFLMIVLSFFPLINIFLFYMIWRKLNHNLFRYFGKSYRNTDRIILVMWVLALFAVAVSMFVPIAEFYFKTPEFVSAVRNLKNLSPLIKSMYLLIISVLFLEYFLGFRRGGKTKEAGEHDLIPGDLID